MSRPLPLKIDSYDEQQPVSIEHSKSGLRLKHRGSSRSEIPSSKSPVAWSVVVPTHRRESAIEGLVLGCAVAESLSIARQGLHPRLGLKLFGRPPLSFEFVPGLGVSGPCTHTMIMAIQSMLVSRTDTASYASQLKKRIAWYQRAFPIRHLFAHFKGLMRLLTKRNKDEALQYGFGDDPLVRSIVMSVMLQGCTNRAIRWFQAGISVSHTDARALHAGLLVGYAAQLAQVVEQSDFEPVQILERLIATVEDPSLKLQLETLLPCLTEKRSVKYAACRLGWADGLPNSLNASAVMGIYAWLRHFANYRVCVERTITLGGHCAKAAVVAGSLSGISLSRKTIPPEWLQSLSLYPYNKQWQENVIERVKDWPHGVEDIQRAHGVPSFLVKQILRNVFYSPIHLIHGFIRIPLRMTQFFYMKRPRRRS